MLRWHCQQIADSSLALSAGCVQCSAAKRFNPMRHKIVANLNFPQPHPPKRADNNNISSNEVSRVSFFSWKKKNPTVHGRGLLPVPPACGVCWRSDPGGERVVQLLAPPGFQVKWLETWIVAIRDYLPLDQQRDVVVVFRVWYILLPNRA